MSDFRRTWHNITLTGAKRVRGHALLKASERGVAISVVVVDRAGVLLLLETSDNSAPGSADASILKAKGACRYGIATHLTAEFVKNIPVALAQHALSLPDACVFQGGAPIRFDDKVLGGVGISGGRANKTLLVPLLQRRVLSNGFFSCHEVFQGRES